MAQDAYRDALTGIGNRRHFSDVVQAAITDADRFGRPLGIVVLDIDHFKAANDTYGHASGDAVLRAVAAALEPGIQSADTVFRIGGEEFAILVAELEPSFVILMAERLRAAVAALCVPVTEGYEVNLTISLGFASGDAGETGPTLLQRADAALYAAKRGGRDRLTLAG